MQKNYVLVFTLVFFQGYVSVRQGDEGPGQVPEDRRQGKVDGGHGAKASGLLPSVSQRPRFCWPRLHR